MPIAMESDSEVVPDWQLFLRGLVVVIMVVVASAAMVTRSQGTFRDTVEVTADLVNVGDGLPEKSDVKYRGILVGLVRRVEPATRGGPNHVHIELRPDHAPGIPATVTARVVPSNVFAVPSIQLVDNGRGPGLTAGAHIPEDRSLDTVRLQTSLTALSAIADAAGRGGSEPALGLLALAERASSGRGADAVRSGAELTRIAETLNRTMTLGDTTSTLTALSQALTALQSSAPDLLSAVHTASGPLRAAAERREQLHGMLSGGLTTGATVAAALENNTATLTGITARLGPVVGVLGDGSRNFLQISTSLTAQARTFNAMWNAEDQSITAKIIIELTPHRAYTRADCPRYGTLEAPSCRTAPPGEHTIIGPDALAPPQPPRLIGGNVGPIGSPQEQRQIASILGIAPNTAADILLGPVLRGNDVTTTPATDSATPTGGQR
ncbi:MlaD family protein [Nocardia wallacei]|uniref:MlaD family protein n=1 Tax=Nocardia wallacei TaxID=480035 RepID=UPI0024562B28|nr:MCE family protein [Nocardia wallacei]